MSAAEQSTLDAAALERFAELDPDVVWRPGQSAGDAVCRALDKVREREHEVLEQVERGTGRVTAAHTLVRSFRFDDSRETTRREAVVELENATRHLTRALVAGGRRGAGAVLVDPTATTGDVDPHGDVVDEARPLVRQGTPSRRREYDDAELDRQRAVAEALARRVGVNLSLGEAGVVVQALELIAERHPGTKRAERALELVTRLRPRIERARAASRSSS